MSNKMAVKIDTTAFVISRMKTASNHKARVYNESKNVFAKSFRFIASNPRLVSSLPVHRKNGIYYIQG